MLVLSSQSTRDTCTRLYAGQAVVVRGLYEASTVPAFAKEWQRIPEEFAGDRYSSRSVNRLVSEHGWTYDEANAVVDEVCDPASGPPRR